MNCLWRENGVFGASTCFSPSRLEKPWHSRMQISYKIRTCIRSSARLVARFIQAIFTIVHLSKRNCQYRIIVFPFTCAINSTNDSIRGRANLLESAEILREYRDRVFLSLSRVTSLRKYHSRSLSPLSVHQKRRASRRAPFRARETRFSPIRLQCRYDRSVRFHDPSATSIFMTRHKYR